MARLDSLPSIVIRELPALKRNSTKGENHMSEETNNSDVPTEEVSADEQESPAAETPAAE